MKKVILHIGMPKTGTSALQIFFLKNKGVFEKNDIGFFSPQKYKEIRDCIANGSFLRRYAQMLAPEKGNAKKEHINPMRHEVDKENTLSRVAEFSSYADAYQTIILSEELIWWGCFFYEDWCEIIQKCIQDLCGDVIIQPLIYLRRQDTWSFSWWKEYLRLFTGMHEEIFPKFLSWIEELGVLDYNNWLLQMEDVFGIDNIILRTYEEAISDREAIFRDFVSALNLDWQDDFNTSRKLINPSLSLMTDYALLRILGGDVPYVMRDAEDRTLLRRGCRLFSVAHKEKKPCYPLPLTERTALIERYKGCNKAISERYERGGTLFSYDIEPYEILTEDRERDIENAKEIIELTKIPHSAYQWLDKHSDNF